MEEINYKIKYLHEVDNNDARVLMYSYRERYALTFLFDKMNEDVGYNKFELIPTTAWGFDPYDAVLIHRNRKEEIVNVFIVEAKIRTNKYTSFTTLFLEHNKFEKMKSIRDNVGMKYNVDEIKMLYVNFIENDKTYIYHLDNFDLPKSIWNEMNEYTFRRNGEKKKKRVYELDKCISQHIDYVYNEDNYVGYEQSLLNIVGDEKKKVKMINLETLIKKGLEEYITK